MCTTRCQNIYFLQKRQDKYINKKEKCQYFSFYFFHITWLFLFVGVVLNLNNNDNNIATKVTYIIIFISFIKINIINTIIVLNKF